MPPPLLRLRTIAALAAVMASAPLAGADAGAQEAERLLPPPMPGASTLVGVVRDTAGRPVAAAEVRIGPVQSDITDAEGRFRISGVEPDTVQLIVRRIGYHPASVLLAVDANLTVELAVTLVPSVVELGTIVIEGRSMDRYLWRGGFYDRQRLGAGTLLGPEQLARMPGRQLSSLLRESPAVRIQRLANGGAVALGKFGHRECPLNVIVDGQLVRWARYVSIDDVVNRPDLHALEIYPRAAALPTALAAQVGTGAGEADCGALVIWTKPIGPSTQGAGLR